MNPHQDETTKEHCEREQHQLRSKDLLSTFEIVNECTTKTYWKYQTPPDSNDNKEKHIWENDDHNRNNKHTDE